MEGVGCCQLTPPPPMPPRGDSALTCQSSCIVPSMMSRVPASRGIFTRGVLEKSSGCSWEDRLLKLPTVMLIIMYFKQPSQYLLKIKALLFILISAKFQVRSKIIVILYCHFIESKQHISTYTLAHHRRNQSWVQVLVSCYCIWAFVQASA